jgi:hypothetical protein
MLSLTTSRSDRRGFHQRAMRLKISTLRTRRRRQR